MKFDSELSQLNLGGSDFRYLLASTFLLPTRPGLSLSILLTLPKNKGKKRKCLLPISTAEPPPTPSSQTNNHSSTPDAGDLFSRLLHRLPPTLSLPTPRSSSTTPPSISFTNPSADALLSERGYFQLVDHPIPSQLALSAESDSISLFNLSPEKKHLIFPSNWPLGYEDDESSESFWLDASWIVGAATEFDLSSLAELTREMEKIGLKIIELLLSKEPGFEDPTRGSASKLRSLMWLSSAGECSGQQDQVISMGRVYPYVVGLTYQSRSRQQYSLLGDSGWVTVSPHVDSVLVTAGDIAQVWSNGLFKKVRGRPVPNVGRDSPSSTTMSLLVTLEADSIVRPLVLPNAKPDEKSEKIDEAEASTSSHPCPANLVFTPFTFEEYAWRIYNERILLKDPLDRYRI